MPYIETVDELVESLADAAGIWGSCPDDEKERCYQQRFCRICWTIEIKTRIWAATAREIVLSAANSTHRTQERSVP